MLPCTECDVHQRDVRRVTLRPAGLEGVEFRWRNHGEPAEPARPAGGGRRLPRPLILAGVAVAALGSGAGIAFAATSSGATAAASATSVAASPSPSPSGPHGPAR